MVYYIHQEREVKTILKISFWYMFFYIHIPFCRQKCQYCHFTLTPKFNELKVRIYIDALKKEIEEFFKEIPFYSPLSGGQEWFPFWQGENQSIYFGGGTPSILTDEQLAEILDIFRRQKGFLDMTELTLESNPEDITNEYLNALSELWVNRLSLGIQTLNEKALHIVGRADSNKAIFCALECISTGPIENISIDLIAGLPYTTAGQIVSDLEQIFSYMTPKHVSIYMLENENYPVNWKRYLPSEEIIREEYVSGVQFLQNHGFHRYELSNFAQPGFESKHNQSYWNHFNYRGFWLSAASYIDGERFINSSSFSG